MDYEKLLQKAEKKGIKPGCKVIIDGDKSLVYTVLSIHKGIGESRMTECQVFLTGELASFNWNANSPRLRILREEVKE